MSKDTWTLRINACRKVSQRYGRWAKPLLFKEIDAEWGVGGF
jgi:hypothetical protein